MKLLALAGLGLIAALAAASPTGLNTDVAASKYKNDGTHKYAITPPHRERLLTIAQLQV
jgi:hypothetical protein